MDEGRLKEAKRFFMGENMKSDAVIEVEAHEFQVDMNIISLASSTLANEFQPHPDPISPPGETNKAVAKLVGPVDHILDMLTFIYPNFGNVVNKHNVEYLLQLAVKYKLLFLQEACGKYIVEALSRMQCMCDLPAYRKMQWYDRPIMERLVRYFALAHQTDLVEARKRCMDKLVIHPYSEQRKYKDKILVPTRNIAAFKQLDPTTRGEIERNRVLYLEGTYGKVTDKVEDL
ncbi:uncharacterized protein LOC124262419 [Haliotis rubra]|uniref:uncharacterized protein LOC124262419 n=1 Tax=Haliotis rubra TaxID=36100 RepID=UPI001EE4F05E|nr:uncharacterized protein LOC124262419 [Haliotis rubra]